MMIITKNCKAALILLSFSVVLDAQAQSVEADLIEERIDLIDNQMQVVCTYAYGNELFALPQSIRQTSSRAPSVNITPGAPSNPYEPFIPTVPLVESNSSALGCDYSAVIELSHSILGSNDVGWARSEKTVISDIAINDLRVRKVRDNTNSCHHLELDGRIDEDSAEALRRIVQDMPSCTINGVTYYQTIYMNSLGGLLKYGYEIGKLLRESVIEAQVVDGQICASACALAFIAAQSRSMSGSAKLVFHAPYTISNGSVDCRTSNDISENLLSYYEAMIGADNATLLFQRTMSYCSSSDGWTINSDAAKLFGVVSR